MTTAAPTFRWKVVGAAFVVAMFAWGTGFYGPSIFLQALHAGRGWPIATLSAAVTAHYLCSAVLVTGLPAAHRRFGIAPVTMTGIAATALGLLAWGQAAAPWQLFVAAPLTGLGWATTSGAAINAMVSPWFDGDRPKALSLAFNGASLGGVALVPLWAALIAAAGFAAATAIVALAMVACLWPLALRYLAPTPATAGHTPPLRTTRRALLRNRRFLTLSLAFALGLFPQIGVVSHLATRLAPVLGPEGAAWAISLAAACAVAGRTLLGWGIGGRDRRVAAALNFAVQATGTALLAFADGAAPLLAGCVLFGLGLGNLISLPPMIAQREFAAGDVGTVVALITAANQALFAFAPALFGLVRDATGGYATAFALALAFQLTATAVVLGGRGARPPGS